MKIEIKHWWRPEIVASVEIDAKFESSNYYIQLGAAVQVAVNEKRSLDGARLDGARLVGARLDGARLDGASLDGARLDGASLVGARLVGARLVGARLDGASLDGASLVGARLDGARLDGASLDGASLVGARLRGIRIKRVIARLTRTIESFEFIAVRAEDGRCMVIAGCRGPWTIDEYRAHVKGSYPKTDKGNETLAILDFIESRDKADAKAEKKAKAA